MYRIYTYIHTYIHTRQTFEQQKALEAVQRQKEHDKRAAKERDDMKKMIDTLSQRMEDKLVRVRCPCPCLATYVCIYVCKMMYEEDD